MAAVTAEKPQPVYVPMAVPSPFTHGSPQHIAMKEALLEDWIELSTAVRVHGKKWDWDCAGQIAAQLVTALWCRPIDD